MECKAFFHLLLEFAVLHKKEVVFMYSAYETAERIKLRAKSQNILIKDMLNSCEMNKNALSTMFSRGSWLQANNIAKVADYLECSIDYLLGRTDNPEIQQKPESSQEITSMESNLLSMFKMLSTEQQEDIFDFVFVKYKKLLSQKTDTYSDSPTNSSETA